MVDVNYKGATPPAPPHTPFSTPHGYASLFQQGEWTGREGCGGIFWRGELWWGKGEWKGGCRASGLGSGHLWGLWAPLDGGSCHTVEYHCPATRHTPTLTHTLTLTHTHKHTLCSSDLYTTVSAHTSYSIHRHNIINIISCLYLTINQTIWKNYKSSFHWYLLCCVILACDRDVTVQRSWDTCFFYIK